MRRYTDGIHYLQKPIMQYGLGVLCRKKNTSCLLLGLFHASVNWICIVLVQITPQKNIASWDCASGELNSHATSSSRTPTPVYEYK